MKLFLVFVLSCACFAQDGAAVYQKRCAMCHDSPKGRIPSVEALRAMSNAAILRALETGAMREQAKDLSTQERQAVAAYLASGGSKPVTASAMPASAYCSARSSSAATSSGADWNGFGANLNNTRFQSKDAAGITASDVPKLQLKWAFSLGDVTLARGQPVVVDGRLYAVSAEGKVYALDAKSGCVYWVFDADAGIRSGVIVGSVAKHPAVFLGDMKANAYAVDVTSGKLIWKSHLDDHPLAVITDAPSLSDGVLYYGVSSFEEVAAAQADYPCCTFRGSVVALEAASGKTLWKTYTIAQTPAANNNAGSGGGRFGPSGAAAWSTPTVDLKRDVIYVSTGDNYSEPATETSDSVLALDRNTGKVLWTRQMTPNDAFTVGCFSPEQINCPKNTGPDFDFGQPPILASLPGGKQMLVIGQKSGTAYGLDPDQGKIIWQTRVGKGTTLGGIQWGSATDGKNMYVALSDISFTMRTTDPRDTTKRSFTLDPSKGGGLFALDLQTGNRVWSAPPPSCGERKNCSPAQPAAVSAIPGVVFSGSVDGYFRAYAADTGKIVWEFDTVRDYDAVNGIKAHGGALDGGGPAIAGGMVYTYSGYGQWGGVPGNALLAFSVDGK